LVVACGGVSRPDLGTIDALARLKLATLRYGQELRLRDCTAELLELLDLVGLRAELLGSAVEVGGQPEEREQMRGVEEEADP
jgi:hypothetical protein